jgi:pyruvate dehydrogenase E2 component (dihydrolipoamide acetyltransferase)
VRQLAKDLGVTLEGIRGTGPGGAVTAADVRGATEKRSTPAPPAAGNEERIPVRGLRRRIAEHMKHSISTAAHFTFVAECDMSAVVEHRMRLKERAEKSGLKLTYLAYVLKALIQPLGRFPMLNASLDDERQEIVLKRYYHIGIATHTPEGLTVPVLRDADRRSLFSLARELQHLAEAAKSARLKLDELQGGTFTVTSTGAHGGVLATPILHHPQVAILGIHEIKRRPAVVGDQIVARDLCNLSLSLDHRVVDGAVGADFLYAVVQRLEHPAEWLPESEIE